MNQKLNFTDKNFFTTSEKVLDDDEDKKKVFTFSLHSSKKTVSSE